MAAQKQMTSDANPLTTRATSAATAGPPTPAGQFRAFVGAFERLGYDVERLLADIGVQRIDVDDPDRLIPCEATGALFCRALGERPLKNLSLHLAANTPIGALGLLDHLIVTSDTVGQGLKHLARYLHLFTGAPFRLEIHDDEDPVHVVYHVDPLAPTFAVEYSVAVTALRLREETSGRATCDRVCFTHRVDDADEMERVLGCPVRDGALWSGVALTHDSWKTTFPRKDPIVHRVLEQHAASVLARESAPDGLVADIRRAMASRLAEGKIEIQAIARHLGLSTRTLQRRLRAVKLSYEELLDETRRQAAERCMTDSTLSIGEIAYLLGYSEPAAFHHAFRRWTGTTPQLYRQQRRNGPAASSSS